MTITAAVRSANASSIRLIVKSLTGRGRLSRENQPISVIEAGLLRGLTCLTATSRQLSVPLAVGVFHEQPAMTIVDDDRRGSEH